MDKSQPFFMADATADKPFVVIEGHAYPVCPERGVPYTFAYEDWRDLAWYDDGDDMDFVPKGYVEVNREYSDVTEDCDPQETPVTIWFVTKAEHLTYLAKAAGGTFNESPGTGLGSFADLLTR
jgi:hypothetical protein